MIRSMDECLTAGRLTGKLLSGQDQTDFQQGGNLFLRWVLFFRSDHNIGKPGSPARKQVRFLTFGDAFIADRIRNL